MTISTTSTPATVDGTQRPTMNRMPSTHQKKAVPRRFSLVWSRALRTPA